MKNAEISREQKQAAALKRYLLQVNPEDIRTVNAPVPKGKRIVERSLTQQQNRESIIDESWPYSDRLKRRAATDEEPVNIYQMIRRKMMRKRLARHHKGTLMEKRLAYAEEEYEAYRQLVRKQFHRGVDRLKMIISGGDQAGVFFYPIHDPSCTGVHGGIFSVEYRGEHLLAILVDRGMASSKPISFYAVALCARYKASFQVRLAVKHTVQQRWSRSTMEKAIGVFLELGMPEKFPEIGSPYCIVGALCSLTNEEKVRLAILSFNEQWREEGGDRKKHVGKDAKAADLKHLGLTKSSGSAVATIIERMHIVRNS